MAIDYSALLYDPVYAELGVTATFSAGTGGEVSVTVIDETRRAATSANAIARGQGIASTTTRSVAPAAVARIPELAEKGIDRDAWLDAVLTFNGRSWIVRSYDLLGSPNGEDLGQVRLILKGTGDD